ncbi:MAG: ATP-binding cassette domain-containing protein, partial [Rhizobiales bacterium]|nr:ATP-binding cassette domain-containing protein [Hyphomicrobiales bacterium]
MLALKTLLGRSFIRLHADRTVVVASVVINFLALALPIVLMQIYDRVIPNQNQATLLVLALGLFAAVLIEMIMRVARARLMSYSGTRYELATTYALHRQFLFADINEIERSPVGVHVDRLNSVDRIREFRGGEAACAILDLPFSILFLAVVAWIAPAIAIALALMMLVAISASRRLTKASEELASQRADVESRRHSFLIEVLTRIETIKSIGIGGFMERRYERLMKSSAILTGAHTATSNTAQGLMGATSQITPVLVGAVGAILVSANSITVGAMAAVILLSGRAVQPIMRLEALVTGNLNTKRLESDVKSILDIPVARRGDAHLDSIETLSLNDVAYIETTNGGHLLNENNIEIRRGEIIGILGANGSGKSAIISLMAGQMSPDLGKVLINGRNILDFPPSLVASHIALLSQRPTLLEGTILENMTRFRPALYTEEAVEIATALGMDDYFSSHPKGLTLNIRRGVNLGLPSSIIERVSLVAALLGKPSLILFDEANSAQDRESDDLLREYLGSR